MEVVNATDNEFFDWGSMEDDKEKTVNPSADCDADSSAATSIGESWSRQISDTSSTWKSLQFGHHDDRREGVRSDSLDSSTTGTSMQENSDSDSEMVASGGASEQKEFLDLDDILTIDVPEHEASDHSTIELEASLAIENLKNEAFSQEIVGRDTSTSHVAVAQKEAAKGKDRAAQIQAKWEQMQKRQRDHPPPKQIFNSNRQKLLELVDDLNAVFSKPAFQSRLRSILQEERSKHNLPPNAPLGFVQGWQDLVRSVHSAILPTYGFGSYGTDLGYYSMLLAMEPYCFDEHLIAGLATTDRLLALPQDSTLHNLLDTAEKFLPATG